MAGGVGGAGRLLSSGGSQAFVTQNNGQSDCWREKEKKRANLILEGRIIQNFSASVVFSGEIGGGEAGRNRSRFRSRRAEEAHFGSKTARATCGKQWPRTRDQAITWKGLSQYSQWTKDITKSSRWEMLREILSTRKCIERNLLSTELFRQISQKTRFLSHLSVIRCQRHQYQIVKKTSPRRKPSKQVVFWATDTAWPLFIAILLTNSITFHYLLITYQRDLLFRRSSYAIWPFPTYHFCEI